MPTTAVMLADSVNESGGRLRTFQVRAPRFILPQLSKHRALSISCRSSRAVPVAKMIEEVDREPVVPRFGLNRKGMGAAGDVPGPEAKKARATWMLAVVDAIESASLLSSLGVAKEVCNRILEPYGWFDAVISGTDFDNLYALRIHPDAQHEIRELATLMAMAERASTPTLRIRDDWREPAGWHLPYVTPADIAAHPLAELRSLSAARCGRVSYVPHGSDSPEAARDLERARRMLAERHSVPFEHVACPSSDPFHRSGNFVGFSQMRQAIPSLDSATFDWSTLGA